MKSLHVLQIYIQRLGIWTINLTEELTGNISVFHQYQIQGR